MSLTHSIVWRLSKDSSRWLRRRWHRQLANEAPATMPLSPEQAIKQLSRLPANCVCPNCGTKSKYGFSTVCIKYNTFVCNHCKSSHQAISHRCKSLTMSSWSMAEILEIKTTGNDHCRRVWLGGAPPVGTNGRPKEGESSIPVLYFYILHLLTRRRGRHQRFQTLRRGRLREEALLPGSV